MVLDRLGLSMKIERPTLLCLGKTGTVLGPLPEILTGTTSVRRPRRDEALPNCPPLYCSARKLLSCAHRGKGSDAFADR